MRIITSPAERWTDAPGGMLVPASVSADRYAATVDRLAGHDTTHRGIALSSGSALALLVMRRTAPFTDIATYQIGVLFYVCER